MSAGPIRLPLQPHPASPAPFPCAVEAELDRTADGGLAVRYRLRADTRDLTIPAPQRPARADGLWQHTCFELFVAKADDAPYREFNFSPSGQWAAYAFHAERVRDESAPPWPAPALRIERAPDGLLVEARLAGEALAPERTGAALRLGLSAVVEDAHGVLSYWALHHPAPRPDFHHRESFACELSDSPPISES